MSGRWSGTLAGLEITASDDGDVAGYALTFADGRRIPLNDLLGAGLRIRYAGVVRCRHCDARSAKSFGGGYCYDCFTALARCDLCVVSPDRCHYDAGTCREPEWGEAFCMQAHRVYLANSSGLKVGITRAGRELGRWLDQGAIQGLVILHADTRHAAGLAEVQIASRLADRTDWRKMLRADVPELDLTNAWQSLIDSDLELPDGVRAVRDGPVVRLRYPLTATVSPDVVWRLDRSDLAGNLKGMKGQYLLLGRGAFNVRAHAGYEVELELTEPLDEPEGAEQLGLFG